MKVIQDPQAMSNYAQGLRRRGKSIGFVPTMGYLHAGHLSLIKRARKETEVVVISIFVNPAQFTPREDFKKYPRDFKRDRKLSKDSGVDVIFNPKPSQMYAQDYATYINVERLSKVLCGRSRPGHFRGVTTVVAKLFNIVKPTISYFGQKDAQQAILIRKMVKDLNMDTKIKVLPIVRENDGLAMSSRNKYLSPEERKDAKILFQSLQEAKKMIKCKERNSSRIISSIKKILVSKKSAKIDYVEIVDACSLRPQKRLEGQALIALAVWIGKTRLIDNMIVKAKDR